MPESGMGHRQFVQVMLFNQVFNENHGYQIGEWRAVGRAGGRAGERAGGGILNGVKLRFPLNNFSLLWLIDTSLNVWVAYIKTLLGIAT